MEAERPTPVPEAKGIFGPESPPLRRVEKGEKTDYRDTTLLVLRHGKVEGPSRESPLSDEGIAQARKAAEDLIETLASAPLPEEGLVIKFYVSPKPRCDQTAGVMIGVLERAIAEGRPSNVQSSLRSNSLSPRRLGGSNVQVLKPGPEKAPVPRKRAALDMLRLTGEDEEAILGEYIGRKKEGKPVSFGEVWAEMDKAGELAEESESPEDVGKRFTAQLAHFRDILGRIPPRGPKLLLIGITHSNVLVSVLGRDVGLCEGFRIDFPLHKGENPKLISDGQVQEIRI